MIISITAIRKHLALPNTSWQICLLAIIGGSASALLVVLFTLTIEEIQQLYLLKRDNYNSLDEVSRFDLPIIGSLVILLIAWFTGYEYLRTGIPFVLHRLKVAHGVIPFKNTLNQFWGSAVALASGFSVGREGPAVHLGAACSTYLGSILKLPYNSIRTLCACGIAAGIAATFNTPIAAVIFVMEVIMREYKVHVFVPVMLASIVGSLITRSFFDTNHSFQYFHTITLEQQHYFSLIFLAIILGLLAAAFNKYLVLIIKQSVKYHIVPRLLLAALITGSLGYLVPGAMGTGSNAIDMSFTNNLQFGFLLSLLFAKLLMTMFALGLGIPGGVVGPTLSIGAIAGACVGALVVQILPDEHLGNDFILMGMAGFMAASLNAPLAALLAVVELSGQLELVLPAMIVITISSIVSRQLCKNESIFTMQLDAQNLRYRKPPIEESLQNIGVLAVMKDNIRILDHASPCSIAGEILSHDETQLVINKELTSSNHSYTYYWAQFDGNVTDDHITDSNVTDDHITDNNVTDDENSDVTQNISDKLILHKLIPLNHQATLAEAYLALVEQRSGAVYIYNKDINDCIGLVTFEQLRVYLVEGNII
jgi:CIC family chloride channel protein